MAILSLTCLQLSINDFGLGLGLDGHCLGQVGLAVSRSRQFTTLDTSQFLGLQPLFSTEWCVPAGCDLCTGTGRMHIFTKWHRCMATPGQNVRQTVKDADVS